MGIKKKTTNQFKIDVEKKYGKDQYTIIGEYINNKTPILVKHNICGNIFLVRPDIFLRYTGTGCGKCSPNKKLTDSEFREKFRQLEYSNEYEILDDYVNSNTKITVLHKICGKSRKILPHRLLNGDRCCFCYGNMRKDILSFKKDVRDISNDTLECKSEQYTNNKECLLFKCKVCGKEFRARPNNILSGCGCPSCSKSKGEKIISKILSKHKIPFIEQKTFNDLFNKSKRNKLKFDFEIQLGNTTILLEFDGEQHFHSVGRFTKEIVNDTIKRDILKNKYCLKNNLLLMRIPYTEFKNLNTIIESLISSTTIPDEFRVVGPSGSKRSAELYKIFNSDDIV